MKLADISIKRPVFATMMIMALVVLGLFSLVKLNVDLYPDVDIPFVIITTILPGAGPEQIETDVTKKIEDAVNPVAGVDWLQSYSQEGVSIVVIAFKLEVDGKVAAQDVREKISAIRGELPLEIEDPIIQRYDPANFPIMSLTVSGSSSEKEITELTKTSIKKRLENIPGVGAVNLVGGAEREIQIEVDAARLRAFNLSIQVAKEVNKQLEKLKSEIPPNINIFLAQDNSIFIKDSINDVLFDIIYGGLLAILVIYLFLANFRATVISAFALPSSIIASFIIMYALNFTLNMMSLLALSLAVGLLIDDAIVVIENIYRHMSQGETPMEAAKSASQEIGLAVMATTFTVVAVFVPVAFMPDPNN